MYFYSACRSLQKIFLNRISYIIACYIKIKFIEIIKLYFKMNKTYLLSFTLLLITKLTFTQIPIGLKIDCSGYAFNGYFDPLTYSPENKITKVHNSDSYEIGYYFDNQGNKIEGLIKFENDQIFFKKFANEPLEKLRPDFIKNFVIGVDSFFAITNFYYKNKLKTKPEYVQYITEFNGLTFVKHYFLRQEWLSNMLCRIQ
jgi:hypothetical protein